MSGEDAVHWCKSSHSGHSGGECVEVASLAPMIGVRDSKTLDGPVLAFSLMDWSAFTLRVKSSEFDLD